MVNALTWVGVATLALCVASWAKYAVDRNSVDERDPRLHRPLVWTGVLTVVIVVVSVLSSAQG